ncbi:MAG: type II toxin-antitoxin system VapC family toxin [Dehalococcoidia bacterium]|nr:type II toxin-antitoxin system VapC family toxin [Dehalococcoidia bacterium]
MTRILLDASAMVPLELPRDQWRARALQLIDGLRRAGPFSFVTTNWTLYEGLALTRRHSWEASASLFEHITGTARVVPVSAEVEAEAVRRFLGWRDKGASVVDHANLLVALEWKCEAVFSFDDDFAPLARMSGLRLVR